MVIIEESRQDLLKEQETAQVEEPEVISKYRHPSKLSILKTIFKLVPLVIRLRSDRREWVKKEGKNVDETKFRKHAEKALNAFISLGPSYIKLGQWLSSRSDVLPQPYLDVFSRLQDDVPPAPFEKTSKIIEAELGPIGAAFESFNNNAISGASLGQVYLARHGGRDVIVKFADTVKEEMDYRMEACNLVTIKNNLKDDPSVLIPQVFPDRTTRHVLTLEYLPGIKITDIEKLDRINVDRSRLVVRVHRLFFKMLLRHSVFHADPHPGNIAVSESGKIILYDFGMVGRLDEETRRKLIRLYLGLIDKDPIRTTDVLIELGTLEPSVNRHVIEKGLQLSIESLYGKKVDRMEVKALQELANKTMSRFPFRLPKNLALYMRMASILEGIYKHHNVKFEFVRVLANLLEEEGLLREAYFEEIKKSITKFVKNLESSIEIAPMIKEYLQAQGQRSSSDKAYRIILPASIFASSIIICSALIYPYEHFFAYLGFAISGAVITGSLVYNKIHGQSN